MTPHDGLYIYSTELSNCKQSAALRFQGFKLSLPWYHSLVGSSMDPFLRLLKSNKDGKIGETNAVEHTNNPAWTEITITHDDLCMEPTRKLKIECFDKSRKDKFIGAIEKTFEELIQGNLYKLRRKGKFYGYTNAGTIKLKEFITTDARKSFVDCMRQGKITLAFAFDFSNTNKDHTDIDSLHRLSEQPNEYETAVESIGIIKYYNDDRRYLGLGKQCMF